MQYCGESQRVLGVGMTPLNDMMFFRAELRTGLTLSRIALTAKREDKIQRNRVNARKAYDCILHFVPSATLSRADVEEIQDRMTELRSNLRRLGEEL